MANYYNQSSGTWIIKGEFNNSIVLDKSGMYIHATSGEGAIVVTYDGVKAKVFSSGVFQYETDAPPNTVNGEGIVLVKNGVSTIADVLFIPRTYSDSEAKIAATGNVQVFWPSQLFANGEQGVWYLPQPTLAGQQLLFQDAAGTVPVENSGDPVGYIKDLSGNGNHATQSTAAAKPIYRTDGTLHWLEFDGVDDYMASQAMQFGQDWTSWAACRQEALISGARSVIDADQGKNPRQAQLIRLLAGESQSIAFDEFGNTFAASASTVPLGTDAVLSSRVSSSTLIVRRDGAPGMPTSITGTPRSLSVPLGIGRQGSGAQYFQGRIYGAIATVDSAESFVSAEEYLASISGVTL